MTMNKPIQQQAADIWLSGTLERKLQYKCRRCGKVFEQRQQSCASVVERGLARTDQTRAHFCDNSSRSGQEYVHGIADLIGSTPWI